MIGGLETRAVGMAAQSNQYAVALLMPGNASSHEDKTLSDAPRNHTDRLVAAVPRPPETDEIRRRHGDRSAPHAGSVAGLIYTGHAN